MRSLVPLALAFLLALAPACAQDSSGDPVLAKAKELWAKQSYAEAADAYRDLRDHHAQHPYVTSGDAQFWYWCCLGNAGKLREEVVEIQAFLKNYPKHGSCEYATYFLGETQRKLGDEAAAKATWEEQLRAFPAGEMAQYAKAALSGEGASAPAAAHAASPDFLEGAEGAARWLARLAEPRGDGIAWTEYQGTHAHPTNLYEGSAGICLYFLNLYSATGNATYRELARKAADGLTARVQKIEAGLRWDDEWEGDDGKVLPRDASSGLYVGSAGIGMVFLALHEKLGDPAYLDAAKGAADAIAAAKDPWKEDTDIISGAAGIGFFLLQMHAATHDAKYQKAAAAAADWLVAHAAEDPAGRKWKSSLSLDRFYTGFSHGAAGNAAFLVRAYESTQDKRYLECAEAGAHWLLANAVAEGGGEKWFHYAPDHQDKFMSGWCHGPAGTCRLFLDLHRVTGKAEYLDAAKKGAEWLMASIDPTKEDAAFWGLSMCCGTAGIGDFFLDLFLTLREDRYLAYAARVGRWLLAHAKADGDGFKWTNCDSPDESGQIYYGTGHMTGAAGAGTFLLRLHCVARNLESRLVPVADKPRWTATAETARASYVVLTNLAEDDPYYAAAKRLAEYRKGTILRFDPAELTPTQRRLAAMGARHVAIVLKPQEIDVNLHRRVLMMSTAMDDDAFSDFAFGYITGPTAKDALRMVETEIRVEAKGLPKTAAEASVISEQPSSTIEDPGVALTRELGWKGKTIYWSCVEDDPKVREFVKKHIAELAGRGIVSLSGNGDPEGIWLFHDQRNCDRSKHWPFDPAKVGQDPKGEMPRILADAFRGLDLSPAVVWSGTCHSGVLYREFVEADIVSTFGTVDQVTEYLVPEQRSLGLAILGAGPSAFLAPIGPNHGFSTLVESWRALATGMPLGDVMRTRYNEIVLAEGHALRLPLYRPGEGELDEDPMRGGGVNRLLYGDPLYQPFADAGKVAVKTIAAPLAEGGLHVTCTVADANSGLFWDMFGGDRENSERLYATLDLPATVGTVTEVTAAGHKCVWGVESIDGRRVLHLQANGPRDSMGKEGTKVEFEVRAGK